MRDTLMGTTSRKQELAVLALLLVIGFITLVLRNSDPLLNPSMYTEDGVWTGFLYSVGAEGTYRNARADYFVLGNIALLQFATTLNSVLFVDQIERLPVIIGVVSYGFYSCVTAFVFCALRSYLALPWRLACWALVLTLPMGLHMNEVFGRLSNVGYAFYVLTTLAVLLRFAHPPKRLSKTVLALDAFALLSAFTNPLCAVLVVAVAIIEVARRDHRRSLNTYILIVFAVLSLVAFELALNVPREASDGKIVTISGLLAAGLARPLLYPFVFPVYSSLTDLRVLGLSAVLGTYFAAAWWIARDRLAFGFLLVALGLVSGATALARPELHAELAGYVGSFPDRYFYAQNVLVLIAFTWATCEFAVRFPRVLPVPLGALGCLGFVFVANASLLFDPFMPATRIRTGPSFAEQLQDAQPVETNLNAIRVRIYPEGWFAEYPARYGVPQNNNLDPN